MNKKIEKLRQIIALLLSSYSSCLCNRNKVAYHKIST